jgi:uncharacterized protein (DUF427 family)
MTAALVRPHLENVEVGKPTSSVEVRFEPTAKRVRCYLDGIVIADSIRVELCLETKRLAVYYFPAADVRLDLLEPSGRTYVSDHKGEATYFDIVTPARRVREAAWRYGARDSVAFHWNLLDAWFEEDEQVFVHARDPHHRIDVLRSKRHVEVSIDGTVVASSRATQMLFETGLPTRYYFPREDVRIELVEPSNTITGCAYKGFTSDYWAMNGRDVAWSYAAAAPEVGRIDNLVAFFNERADVRVDGVLQPRPITPWS